MSRQPWEGWRQTDRRSARRALRQGCRGVNITEDVRKYAAEPSGSETDQPQVDPQGGLQASQQGLAEEEALKAGMAEKSKEFNESGAELYAKA